MFLCMCIYVWFCFSQFTSLLIYFIIYISIYLSIYLYFPAFVGQDLLVFCFSGQSCTRENGWIHGWAKIFWKDWYKGVTSVIMWQSFLLVCLLVIPLVWLYTSLGGGKGKGRVCVYVCISFCSFYLIISLFLHSFIPYLP